MHQRIIAAAAATALFTLPAMAHDVTVQTALGEATVPHAPETVVVLDMAALDTLDALGVPVAMSISPIMVDYLAEYEGDAGTLFEPDFEALNALQPDLIIAGGRSAAQVDALSNLAPTIDMTIWGENMEAEALARLEAYGTIFDLEDEAAALAESYETAVAETREAVADKGNALIVLTNGPRISTYGSESRFGWVHAALELPEAVEELDDATHGEAVSFEFIREVNPDWLLVVDRVAAIGAEGESAQATLDNALVAETTAWSKDQVVYLNAADIYIAGGGIQSMMNTMDLIRDAFDEVETDS